MPFNLGSFDYQSLLAISSVGGMWIYFSRNGMAHIQKLVSWIKARVQTKLCAYIENRKWQKQWKPSSKRMGAKIAKLKPYGRYRYHHGKFIRLPALNSARVITDGRVKSVKESA